MSNKLEDFIRQNRQAFDDKEPGKNVWPQVESSLPLKSKNLWNSLVVWRVAAMLFMALSIYLLLPRISVKDDAGSQAALKEFHDVETFYVSQIDQKEQMIEAFNRPDGLSDFTQDFRQLEAMYSVLKEEMKNSPSSKVKDALVLNLLVRINLLNQQLHKLDQEEEVAEEKERAKVNA
jgi:hypothetical protein